MPKKKYIVTLTDVERSQLEELTKKGKAAAYKVNHARIMLLADTNRVEGGWKDESISQALNISVATIERVRQRLVEQGLEAALSRKPQNNRKPHCLDGSLEAHLIALTCSEPPTGQGHWTMRMLAQRMVELGYVEKISHETVRQTLKKTHLLPVVEQIMGDPSPKQCRICLLHGRCIRCVHSTIRPKSSTSLF